MHRCNSKLIFIGSDNGLSSSRWQPIIWINAGILLTQPLGTNFSEILIKIHIFSFNKIHLKMLPAKIAAILSLPQCVGDDSVDQCICIFVSLCLNVHGNSCPPGQNGWHIADYIFKCIFMNEKFCILVEISLKFVTKGPIDNKSEWVQVMAWQVPSHYLNQSWPDSATHMEHWGRWLTHAPGNQ